MSLVRNLKSAATAMRDVTRAAQSARAPVSQLKTAAAQADPAFAKLKGGGDRLNTSMGKIRTSAAQGGTGLNQLKTVVGQADGAVGKAKGGADKFKASLDKLKSSANGSHDALRDVKSQADAVEKSVGSAGKSAGRTSTGMGGLSKGLKGTSLAQKGLNLAMESNPFGLVMALLLPLISQFINMDKVIALLKKGALIAFKAILGGLKSMAGSMRPILDGLMALFKAPVNAWLSVVNFAIAQLNRIHVSIPGWVPGVGGKSFGVNLPKLPMLAEGGVVPPRSGGRLALLAEAGQAEAVIPLDRLERMLGHGGPADGAALRRLAEAVEQLAYRPVHVQVDSQTIARAVLVGQRQLARR